MPPSRRRTWRCWSSRPSSTAFYVQGTGHAALEWRGQTGQFTVLVRPLRGLEKLIELMGRHLAAGQTLTGGYFCAAHVRAALGSARRR
jgi:hypothetical protein